MKSSSAIPRGVWMLGFVSLFMDISSELIHGLLPVFMVTSLGAGAARRSVFSNLASRITMLVVSVLAGLLWDRLGPGVTFYAGAVFASAALVMLARRSRRSTAA